MAIIATISNAAEIYKGIWVAPLDRDDLAHFGGAFTSQGTRSIFFVKSATYDAIGRNLTLNFGEVRAFNIGSSEEAIFIEASSDSEPIGNLQDGIQNRTKSGFECWSGNNQDKTKSGDERFLEYTDEFPEIFRNALIQMMGALRLRFPGTLVEAGNRKFVNEPDNFFTMTPQIRKKDIRITVRGAPSRFSGGSLAVRPDRPGYSFFKITSAGDIPGALSLIAAARKK